MVGKIRNMEENGRENEEYAKFTIFLRYFMVCFPTEFLSQLSYGR